ncbi:MAG TPA: hypothetical protein VGR16_13230 [Thermomicrobiales bacterium]|nr:hypothetical protein [Thermomicrobiales bacterium]
MKLYHVTTLANARSILSTGFRDGTGKYGFLDYELSGVWLSDEPLTINEGAVGDAVLSVELDLSVDQLANFEVIDRVGCVTLDSMIEDNEL